MTTVALHPSLGRGASDFEDLCARLEAAGFRTIAIEPRGVGDSPPLPDGSTLHDVASDVIAALDGPAHLIGHAFGNRVMRCVAADRPDVALSVTLLAAGGAIEMPPEVLDALMQCFDETLPDDERLDAIATAFFAPGNDPAVWREGWYAEAARAQSLAVQATPREDWWTAGRAPVLIVQGLQDRCAVPENGRLLKAELGDRCTLIELEGAGHALLPEVPDAIAGAVIPFLQSV